jgi:hypothetical protein
MLIIIEKYKKMRKRENDWLHYRGMASSLPNKADVFVYISNLSCLLFPPSSFFL